VTDPLAVAVNRDGLHTLAVPSEFTAAGPFAVELRNHGEAAHVHLNLDDRLSRVARLGATNHYVEADERRLIDVETREASAWPADTVRGKIKIVVGHGQETRYVDVILDRSAAENEVRVDPDLATPDSDPDEETPPVVRLLPVVVLGSVAVLLAVGALFASGSFTLVLGGLALVSAALCAAAAYVLFR
jgi:hypothetical protein